MVIIAKFPITHSLAYMKGGALRDPQVGNEARSTVRTSENSRGGFFTAVYLCDL